MRKGERGKLRGGNGGEGVMDEGREAEREGGGTEGGRYGYPLRNTPLADS